MRVKRSAAKPFLQSLGIDLDPVVETEDDKDKGKDKGKARPTGRTSQTAAGQTSTVRKYFSKPS